MSVSRNDTEPVSEEILLTTKGLKLSSPIPGERRITDVNLSVPQPVEGVRLFPYFSLRCSGAEVDPSELDLRFSWYSSVNRHLCSAKSCILGSDPIDKYPGVPYKCLECDFSGDAENAYFCSIDCFISNWKVHKRLHSSTLSLSVLSTSTLNSNSTSLSHHSSSQRLTHTYSPIVTPHILSPSSTRSHPHAHSLSHTSPTHPFTHPTEVSNRRLPNDAMSLSTPHHLTPSPTPPLTPPLTPPPQHHQQPPLPQQKPPQQPGDYHTRTELASESMSESMNESMSESMSVLMHGGMNGTTTTTTTTVGTSDSLTELMNVSMNEWVSGAMSGPMNECVNDADYKSELLQRALSVSDPPDTWKLISNKKKIKPTQDERGRVLKIVLEGSFGGSSFKYACITNPVLPTPLLSPLLPWIDRLTPVTHPLAPITFTLTAYNALADCFASPLTYSHCPNWALTWEYRSTLLWKQVSELMSEIVCLQEIQKDQFDNWWMKKMKLLGYEGIFAQKTREQMMQGRLDGCATFFDTKKFKLVSSRVVRFNDMVNSELQCKYIDQAQAARLRKGNVVQVVQLTTIDRSFPPLPLTVVNVHVHWDTQNSDVKLWQIAKTLSVLHSLIHSPVMSYVVLCGDFNSEPLSAPYELIMNRSINPLHSEMQNDPLGVIRSLSSTHSLTHSFNFLSAYESILGSEPPFTNFTDNYRGCLDYIFYTNRLLCLSVRELMNEEGVNATGYSSLPSPAHPSDHLFLQAQFGFIVD